jgi:hypothetical protein
MSLFLPVQRATLLIPTADDKKHLFILLTNPADYPPTNTQHTLIVGISSIRQGRPHDSTCCLYVGDHPFIKHESYVNYYYANILETRKLIDGYKNGVFEQRDALSTEVFARVCKGLMESRHTPLKLQQFYQLATGL